MNFPTLMKLLLSETASVAELTFAAEVSRDIDALDIAVEHQSPVVREGAIYGLAKLAELGDDKAVELIHAHATTEELSSGVREAAQEALEWFEGKRRLEKPVVVLSMPQSLLDLIGTEDVELWLYPDDGNCSAIRSDQGAVFPNTTPHKDEKTGKWRIICKEGAVILQEKAFIP